MPCPTPTRARLLLELRHGPAYPADLADLLGVSRQNLSNHVRQHRHGRFDVAWLLVVPLAVLLLIAPKPAGAYEAGRAGSALPPAPSSPYGPLPPGNPVALSVVEYASRAALDKGRTLTGHQPGLR